MIMDPASAIKHEVSELVQLQIHIFKQPSSLSSSQLHDYHTRSERIIALYSELDRIGRENLGPVMRKRRNRTA